MPNHVKNRIKMKGITALPLFTVDDDGEKFFDFNKMIPMPESLNIESGSLTDECIVYHLTDRCQKKINELEPEKRELLGKMLRSLGAGWIEELFKRAARDAVKDADEMYRKGRIYIDNFQKYGHTTWYEWCWANWGTKWNSYSFWKVDENTIEFDTAWSAPEPVMKKLSEMYPNVEIEHKWADEDMGNNSGCCTYLNGEVIHGGYDETEQEAYAHYVECWGETNCLYEEDGVWKRRTCEECGECY